MVSVFTYPDVNTREVGRTRDKRRKLRRESSESRFALYLSLFELFSQKSWSQRLKKTSQHPPVIKTNYWSRTPFNTHRKRTCQEDWLQFLHSIWNGQIKLRTSTQCETHLPALDMINSWSERGKSDRFMKTRNLRKYYNLFINITHLASLGSRLVCSENVLHAGIPSSRAEFFTSTSLCKGFDNS